MSRRTAPPLRAPLRGQNRHNRSRRPSHLQAYRPGEQRRPRPEPPLSRRRLLWGIALLVLGHWGITGSYPLTPWLGVDLFLGALAFGAGVVLILRATPGKSWFRAPRGTLPPKRQ